MRVEIMKLGRAWTRRRVRLSDVGKMTRVTCLERCSVRSSDMFGPDCSSASDFDVVVDA